MAPSLEVGAGGGSRPNCAAGHDVFTPKMTGSGERVHLASPDVDLV